MITADTMLDVALVAAAAVGSFAAARASLQSVTRRAGVIESDIRVIYDRLNRLEAGQRTLMEHEQARNEFTTARPVRERGTG